MTQVELPWMPILCSIEPQLTPLRSPGDPSSLTMNLGTTNNEMPLLLSGAPGVLASTRWMMLLVRSCSPDEMKILVPVICQLPSAFGSARVRIRPRSVPQCGSVRFMVPPHSPDTILGTYIAFCSSDPLASSAAIAPCVSPGYIANAMLAEIIY